MKRMKIASLLTLLIVASATCLRADDLQRRQPSSAEFEKMKSLVGTWHGKSDFGQGPVDMTVQYRLLAGGTVLEERSFPGTPNEMITMFYEKDGKLALTHYCVLGNRPGMVRNLRNILHRAQLTDQEVRTLRGVIVALTRGKVRRHARKADEPPFDS